MISFFIEGQPVAKGRPRFGRGRAYTPAKTRAYELLVHLRAKEAMVGKAASLKPIKLRLVIGMAVPESWSDTKTRRALLGEILPASKPDLDNIIKIIGDGCNHVVWYDDSQIVQCVAEKRYSHSPGMRVEVEEV